MTQEEALIKAYEELLAEFEEEKLKLREEIDRALIDSQKESIIAEFTGNPDKLNDAEQMKGKYLHTASTNKEKIDSLTEKISMINSELDKLHNRL